MAYEPWRWACPEGHASWKPKAEGYICERCGTRFSTLRDMKSGEIDRPANRGGHDTGVTSA